VCCGVESVTSEEEEKFICTNVRHRGQELGHRIGQLNIDRCRRKECPFIGVVKRDYDVE